MKTTNETLPRFWATFEPLSANEAIITLTLNGEWAGSCRVSIRRPVRSDLYDEAYRIASLSAQSKGGILDRFTRGRA